ncbi:MAG: phenylalanine--tRNA ligase subunit beta [Nannocystaceae bacterium]|nr:phenylalanine--tRNA ligase subunit beta [Nannocystaceae bacterium]
MPGRTPLPDDDGLSAAITGLGLEVEGMTRYGDGLEAIIVGEVVGRRPHPKSDKLGLVEIHDGKRNVEVVCGASNVPDAGGRIAFAPEGTVLPGGMTIGARTIRGVESRGMICSEVELEIGSDGDGIMVLPRTWAAGDRLIDRVPGIVDTVFEVSVTPNRPDALGHVGVARDLAVRLRCSLAVAPLTAPTADPDPTLVTLEAPERCGRYFGFAFSGAKIGPSPLWMRVRLHRVGLRPINNVVDITNFISMEWGQPLHAFDRARLAEGRVVVRQASNGETLTVLDGTELTLTEDDLVIADAQRPQALAGVMGGNDAGVQDTTTNLLLETAWFSPAPVRRSARRHHMTSDSAYRFERGVDYGLGLSRAVARATQLIGEITGARLVAGHHARGQTPATPTITLRPARTQRILGMPIPDDEAQRILAGLEIEVDTADPAAWVCRPPTHRPDLSIEEDLIEELMRVHGLDDLPSRGSMPTAYGTDAPTALLDPAGEFSREETDALVDALVATGCNELVGFAFADPEALAAVDPRSTTTAIHVKNPMRSQHGVLRTHLLPGMLDAVALNIARHGRPLRLFEVGRTYGWGEAPSGDGPTAAIDRRLPREHMMAGVVLCGGLVTAGTRSMYDARSVGGVLLDVLSRLGIEADLRPATAEPAEPHLHPGVQAEIWIDDRRVGSFGTVHPDLVRRWDLPDGVAVFYGELNVAVLPKPAPAQVRRLPRFPATSRDLSLDTAATVPAWTVVAALRTAADSLTESAAPSASAGDGPAKALTEDPPRLSPGDRAGTDVEVLEDYRGQGVPDGRRALLLRLHYRAAARSVADNEVQALHDEIVTRALTALAGSDPEIRRR